MTSTEKLMKDGDTSHLLKEGSKKIRSKFIIDYSYKYLVDLNLFETKSNSLTMNKFIFSMQFLQWTSFDAQAPLASETAPQG